MSVSKHVTERTKRLVNVVMIKGGSSHEITCLNTRKLLRRRDLVNAKVLVYCVDVFTTVTKSLILLQEKSRVLPLLQTI